MLGKRVWHKGRVLALGGIALALAGCGGGGGGSLFNGSPLDLFSSSSKATNVSASGEPQAPGSDDVECPEVKVRTGASTLVVGTKPGEAEPAALDVRYQGSILRMARECQVSAGMMTMKIGIEGRIITGPAGAPGAVDVPLRLAVVQEGVNPKTIVSRFAREQATLGSSVDRATFTHVEEGVTFPLPQPLGLIDSYVVYVGFDPLGMKPEPKKPAPRRTPAKPRPKQS